MVNGRLKYKQERQYWGSQEEYEVTLFIPVGWDVLAFYNKEIDIAKGRARGMDKTIEKTVEPMLKEYLLDEQAKAEKTAAFWVSLKNKFKDNCEVVC